MRYLCRHTHALAQCGMRVDGFAYVYGVCTHLDGQGDSADHVAGVGADRVGVRLSPLNSYNSMKDSDPVTQTALLAEKLNTFNLAYLHLMRADFFGVQKADAVSIACEKYKGVLLGNMGYTPEEAEAVIAEGKLDAVAFGTSFFANPYLPERIKLKAALNTPDSNTFYTPGARGYADFPMM
jgi:N-ethylmaleimide reductase